MSYLGECRATLSEASTKIKGRAAPGRLRPGSGRPIIVGMGQKVLLVDDSLVARLGMKKILKDTPFEVVEAASGEDALAAIDGGLRPVFVFLDLTMPGMGGLNALRELRRRDAKLPIVVVTADIQKATVEEAREAGATELLPKPAERAAVLDALARAGLGR